MTADSHPAWSVLRHPLLLSALYISLSPTTSPSGLGMFSTSFSRIFTLCSALASLSVSYAAPHARRASQIPPNAKFILYTDTAIGGGVVLPPLEQIEGFNVM